MQLPRVQSFYTLLYVCSFNVRLATKIGCFTEEWNFRGFHLIKPFQSKGIEQIPDHFPTKEVGFF